MPATATAARTSSLVTEYITADQVTVGDNITLGVGSKRCFAVETLADGRVRLTLGVDGPRAVKASTVVARHRYAG